MLSYWYSYPNRISEVLGGLEKSADEFMVKFKSRIMVLRNHLSAPGFTLARFWLVPFTNQRASNYVEIVPSKMSPDTCTHFEPHVLKRNFIID